jgi:hypothetical protein
MFLPQESCKTATSHVSITYKPLALGDNLRFLEFDLEVTRAHGTARKTPSLGRFIGQ